MKKISYISILLVLVFMTSCFEEYENWQSATTSYDGRYVVAQTCQEYDGDNTTIEDGDEVMIYNSSASIENEVLVDCHIAGLPLRGKFNVSGSSATFSATEVVDNIERSTLGSDTRIIYEGEMYAVSAIGSPAGLGEEYDGIQFYSSLSLTEGKIITEGATTIGGNVSDSVYLSVVLYSDYFVVESYELPAEEWALPDTPEYDWRIKEGSRSNADGYEEHWTLSGYRYTGFPEDDPSTQPPIVVK